MKKLIILPAFLLIIKIVPAQSGESIHLGDYTKKSGVNMGSGYTRPEKKKSSSPARTRTNAVTGKKPIAVKKGAKKTTNKSDEKPLINIWEL